MTTAERDVETARDALAKAALVLKDHRRYMSYSLFDDVLGGINAALAALNGDAGEEWTVHRENAGDFSWYVLSADGKRRIAKLMDEATARRVVAMPALERAAAAAERCLDECEERSDQITDALRALRSALAGEQGT